ncbi:ribulose-phosphate 3-epimerase [Bdellovibrio bacteriovorus]|uniref:Ribulose-phosphate 3-epimerase n=1 Tax=Bdellovibrio bacteriovorus (strain ATCC 15356 / DSM 50701 / NCIMB 9529 / HD100) TaxID=264462 RepID=Q6MJL8_BDEBA|nr:probable ribulose-phosphate 3-epimerase [Bdellovibrio bacteriovorus HD100]
MVAPSILSADFANLEKEIKAVAQAGADWIHVDVMDGRFVPNITIGIPVVKALKKVSPLPLDVHLMIEEPERYVEEFVKAGSDYLTIHVESTKDAAGTLKRIRELGAKPGITLRPRTAVEEVLPLLPLCDLVLVMTVEPGFGGQSFMNDQVAKITRLRQEISSENLSCLIEVDGGINAETAKICHEADVFVAGSYVFGKEYGSAIASLKGS